MTIKISDGNIKVKKVVLYDDEQNIITALYYRDFIYNIDTLAISDNFNIDTEDDDEKIGLNSFPETVSLKKDTLKGLVYGFDNNEYYTHVGLGIHYHKQKEYKQLNCIIPQGTKYIETRYGIISEYLMPQSIEDIEEYSATKA